MKLLKSRSFTWKEVGLLKITLISIGILLAQYFADFFGSYTGLWWAIALVGSVYFLAKYVKEG